MVRCVLAFLSLALLLAMVLAEVPSYIQVCGRKNPELDKCVMESVRNLMPRLKTGIPELSVPSLEPLDVEKIPLANLDTFRAVATNVKLRGLSQFKIKYLRVDLDKLTIDIEVLFPEVYMDSDYDVQAKILVPINEKGPIHTLSENVDAKVAMKLGLTERKGKKLLYFQSMTTKLTIGDYKATFMPDSETNPIAQAINSVLVTSRKEIIESMVPNIEAAVSKKILEVSNTICKHFTYDELFPDRA